jgi:hypothetical protein
MKLNTKLEVVAELPKPKMGHREAVRMFAKAVSESGSYLKHLRAAKDAYVNCCFDFYTARFAFDHGQWGVQCDLFKKEISDRTIQRRVADAEIMIVYAMEKFKELKTIEAIRAKYNSLPLPAVQAMVQDMRDSGIARKFGEYFEGDYLEKKKAKLLGQGEFNFDFNDFASGLQLICNQKAELPHDLDKLEELEGTLKSAASRVRHQIAELKLKQNAGGNQ